MPFLRCQLRRTERSRPSSWSYASLTLSRTAEEAGSLVLQETSRNPRLSQIRRKCEDAKMRIESPQNLVSVPANALCVFPAVPLLDLIDAFQIPLHVFWSLLSWALALLWLAPCLGITCSLVIIFLNIHQLISCPRTCLSVQMMSFGAFCAPAQLYSNSSINLRACAGIQPQAVASLDFLKQSGQSLQSLTTLQHKEL